MKKTIKSLLTGAMSLAFLFSAAPVAIPQISATAYAEVAANRPSEPVYVDFVSGRIPANFIPADGWTNGDPFNVFWHKENVTFRNGLMQLIIDKDRIGNDKGLPYSGGEFRSEQFYGYGRYEVRMKALKNDGALSSFFTCTGPYDDGNPWDEIDIEILGKDTTQVQFNYYRDGKGGHEYMYDLGFDAAQDFHIYAFEWHKDCIIWFVDGKEAYRVESNDIPVTKGKILMNAWTGKGVDEWLKPFKDNRLPIIAEYQWFRFTPFVNE